MTKNQEEARDEMRETRQSGVKRKETRVKQERSEKLEEIYDLRNTTCLPDQAGLRGYFLLNPSIEKSEAKPTNKPEKPKYSRSGGRDNKLSIDYILFNLPLL